MVKANTCTNLRCQEGQYYEYWVEHNKQEVLQDWLYCETCHPESDTDSVVPNGKWEQATCEEFVAFKEQGYEDITGLIY